MVNLKTKCDLITFLTAVIIFPLSTLAVCQEKDIETVFPLRKGNYWIYRGAVRWTKPNSNEVVNEALTWKMEIVEIINRRHITAAVLKGHPADLVCYEEGKERGDHLIIRVGSGKFYMLSDESGAEALKRLRDERDSLQGLLKEYDEPFLDLPLATGNFFGNTDQITRQDGMYCWAVENSEQLQLKNIKGISSTDKLKQYRLAYRTYPDHMLVDFVPGIGITKYEYVHHGTIMEVDVKLTECHIMEDC